MLLTSSSMPESTVLHGHARGFLNQPHFYCIIVTWLTWLSGSSHLATSNRISLETAKCSELNPFRETVLGQKVLEHISLGSEQVPYVLKSYQVPSSHFHPRAPCLWSGPFLISDFSTLCFSTLSVDPSPSMPSLGLLWADSQLSSPSPDAFPHFPS